ncbi:hypothetical protein [Actinomadura harenae]|uniref:Spore-associated protein A n=1 Tax=Actinomadura harenae TaxID=2483351 RepID=A0A3M2M9A8_9ACTN|nr:hypothetical protein [Actinomadura harenae]RMI46136.1 hypothetical protein EBO15_07900 [Actinomadura harenae]
MKLKAAPLSLTLIVGMLLPAVNEANALADAPAIPAVASDGCSGTLVETEPIDTVQTSTTVGYLNLYWDGSTGQNCATATSASVDWGVVKPMGVTIYQCAGSAPCSPPYNLQRSDPAGGGLANYGYYAGPVSVPGAGHCVWASAGIIWNGDRGSAVTRWHC